MPGSRWQSVASPTKLGGDPLILADAAETLICVLLSISTLTGLVLFELTGATWLDPVAGFVIAAFAIHEGREAWEGELVEDDDDDVTGPPSAGVLAVAGMSLSSVSVIANALRLRRVHV